MSILSALRRYVEERASTTTSGLTNPEPWVVDWLDTGPTASGSTVSEETSLRVTAVWACVRLIAGTVASLPLRIYRRRPDGGKDKADDHWLYSILHDEPNPEMTSFQWRESNMTGALLWGNAYTFIQLDGAGRVTSLWPITSDRVTVTRDDTAKDLRYTVTVDGAQEVELRAWQMLHVPGLGFDGIIGRSPISLCREAVGLSQATEEFGARYFGQGSMPGLALEHPGKLSPEALQNIKRSWRDLHQGVKRAHEIAVLQEGMKANRYGIPPEDAQFLETRRFQVSEIARIFGVPPHMIGDVERSTSWGAGIEAQGIGFVTYVLRPWLVRWEQAINMKLFSTRDRRAGYFAEFAVDGLLRGDFATRTAGYTAGISAGWLTRNEARSLENLNPLEGLEDPLQPLNMVALDQDGEPQTPPAEPAAEPATEPVDESGRWMPLLTSTWARILRRYRNDHAGALKAGRVAALLLEVRQYGLEQFEPIAAALGGDRNGPALFDRAWSQLEEQGTVKQPSTWTDLEALAGKCAERSIGG